MTAKYFQVVALAVLFGCAGSGTRTPVAPRTATYLSAAEVAAAHAEIGTAYDAIARLRPNWLAAHGMSTLDPRQGIGEASARDHQIANQPHELVEPPEVHADEMRGGHGGHARGQTCRYRGADRLGAGRRRNRLD